MKVSDDEGWKGEYDKIRYGEKNAESEERRIADTSIVLGGEDLPKSVRWPVLTVSIPLQGERFTSQLVLEPFLSPFGSNKVCPRYVTRTLRKPKLTYTGKAVRRSS